MPSSRCARRATLDRSASARPAARRADRRQGHHRHRRSADRDGLADLSRPPAARPTPPASALVRAAGAVILGKTVTCEFAGMTPGITTNPHDTAHTPGGSSSGSGAAVADFMVPAAFGTQTGGSVLRPACLLRRVRLQAHVRRVQPPRRLSGGREPRHHRADRALARRHRASERGAGIAPAVDGAARPIVRRASASAARRCGTRRSRRRWRRSRTPRRGSARPARSCARSCCRRNSRACATPRARPSTITSAPPRWRRNGTRNRDRISERLRKRIEIGRAMAHADYLAALRLGEDCRARLPHIFGDIDVLLTPCANGEAPRGLDETGDPGFQAIWTILHTPALSLPTHRGPNGLPVGIQLVGRRYDDQRPHRLRALGLATARRAGAGRRIAGSPTQAVMPGLVSRASTSCFVAAPKTWMAGTSPAMTERDRIHGIRQFVRGAAAAGARPGRCCSTSSASRPACRAPS